jgi:alkylhydroperoxidase family enzyme
VPTPLFRLQAETRHAVVDGPGSTDAALRRQVASGQPPLELATLVKKIFEHAYTVTDADVDALRHHYGEEQLFELIVAAAVGASEYRLEAALAALEGA